MDGGEFTLGVPDEGERVAGIVVESGGERYVHRLSVQAFPSVVGLAGLTFRQGSTADGPVIRPGYDGKAGEGSGSIYAVVGENVSTVRLELQSDKANIQVSGNLQIENKGGGVWILWPKQGVNAIHISVEPENYNYSDIHVDLIRGAMPLEDLDITSAEGYETVSYEKTGPQQYYAATQMERISLYPSMRDYHGQFEIWAHGSKLASKYDPISLAEGWNDDIYIHTYDYHGGIVNIYQVVVWQGAGDPSEIGIDWNLRDEFANAATLVENNRGVIGPESSYATITPVVTGGQIERVYVDGTESFQGEAVGSYDITLGELNDGESSSAEVSLIVRIPGNKLVPKKLKLVRGVMADDAVMFAPAGETTSVGLQIHLPAGIAATPTIQVTQQPAYGSYEITESTLSYTPNEGFVGTDTIFFQVSYTYNEEGGGATSH
ncbi:Ig-like domain-containing protein [Cohnella ginsengisoli]|uniref:Ig-like domain-containing protein n=1 Tax=Cohnella ginsengisoli TaxID=425004 RepID=UPI002406293A|nr:Ig-like domain-containing protein [Cohnella ginsengisoli]